MKSNPYLMTILLFSLWISACPNRKNSQSPIPTASRQLILVLADSMDQPEAVLYRFEHENADAAWQKVTDPVPVIIGKNGLGWGRGLQPSNPNLQPVKKEGDGKSPAGVFALGTVFGFAEPSEVSGLKMPYQHVTEVLECVDDTGSIYYNKLVLRDEVQSVDWQSSERMLRYDPWYRWGVFVLQNSGIVDKSSGSCIFLHNSTGPGDRTTGCTAIDPVMMQEIVFWLDEARQPVLVQLPISFYRDIRDAWKMPVLP